MNETQQLRCFECGRIDAPDGDWGTASDPKLGSMTQCPDCGSTNVQTKR